MIDINDIKETDWYRQRPLVIQQAIDILPPVHLYRIKDTGKQCFIVSYEEPKSNDVNDVTVTIEKTGVGGVWAGTPMQVLDTNQVMGYSLTDLEVWK